MVELKEKIIKYLLLSGKKVINEKKIKIYFKQLNTNSKKKVKSLVQFIIFWSSFIFKCSTKINRSYFFVSRERIFFAIKQIIKFNFFKKSIEIFKKEFLLYKKMQNKFVITKNLLHFYRWNKKIKIELKYDTIWIFIKSNR